VDGIRHSIGADTLGYISLDGVVAASDQPKSRLCRACFDGEYPIALPDVVGKHVLEGIEKSVGREPEQMSGYSAEDALSRP
jgi:amidophosphoribosyltransferase